jgi:hypothetical protein
VAISHIELRQRAPLGLHAASPKWSGAGHCRILLGTRHRGGGYSANLRRYILRIPSR